MKILFVSDNFPPESNAPAARLWEHATRWVKAGHEVTVITCAPNFPEGKVYEGHRNRWRQVEEMAGIRVVRVKTYITANEGFLKRTLDYMSFMVMALIMGLFERRPDVVVATSPQFFCAVGGWALSVAKWRPFVFELRDLWPASIMAVGAMKKSLTIRVLEKVELFLYRRASAIIAVTNSFKQDLVSRGVESDKIHVVRNGVDLEQYRPMTPDEGLVDQYNLKGKFVVGYLGTHGMAHALPKVLEAAEILRDRSDIIFIFAGAGAARALVGSIVGKKKLGNVRLIPRQPKEKMPALWSLCNVTVVPLKNNSVFSTVIPSKIFEAMAMGVPIVMSLPAGEATEIIDGTRSGICVPPENPDRLAGTIESLSADKDRMAEMRRCALEACQSYSRKESAGRMLDVLQAAKN